eukprot:3840456-Alexandrium_andersonii.AAC.1
MSTRPWRAPSGRPARRPRQTCGSGCRASRPRSHFPHRPHGRRPRCPPLSSGDGQQRPLHRCNLEPDPATVLLL